VSVESLFADKSRKKYTYELEEGRRLVEDGIQAFEDARRKGFLYYSQRKRPISIFRRETLGETSERFLSCTIDHRSNGGLDSIK
jgi:hypothetical protein